MFICLFTLGVLGYTLETIHTANDYVPMVSGLWSFMHEFFGRLRLVFFFFLRGILKGKGDFPTHE